MAYEQCAEADYCRAEGMLSIREVNHVKMGRLELPDGRCVNVSLPAAEVRRLERDGPEHRIVEGKVFPAIADADLVTLEVNGRRVGWSQCGQFYIFVE